MSHAHGTLIGVVVMCRWGEKLRTSGRGAQSQLNPTSPPTSAKCNSFTASGAKVFLKSELKSFFSTIASRTPTVQFLPR